MLKSQNMPQSPVCIHFDSSSSWFTETKTEDSMQSEHLMWSNEFEERKKKHYRYSDRKCARRVVGPESCDFNLFISVQLCKDFYRADLFLIEIVLSWRQCFKCLITYFIVFVFICIFSFKHSFLILFYCVYKKDCVCFSSLTCHIGSSVTERNLFAFFCISMVFFWK